METITNVVNTVSGTVTKAIYGEQQPKTGNETAGNEPVSGVQGEGTSTEPYDQGNSEDPTDPITRNETAGKEPVSGLQGKGTITEPFDQGNSADPTNITSLPIREKSSLESTPNVPDLSAKPTIPTTDAFNSATAANASTAAHTSTITSQETSTATQSVGGGDAGAGDTKNLSDTLSKTHISNSSAEPKSLETTDGTAQTPGLAGFGDKTSIDPSDKTQFPTSVSNVTTTPNAAAVPTDVSSSTATPAVKETKSDAGAAKEADRVLESAHEDESFGKVVENTKADSPSGEKEKVSKMEKLKEKLHIGHKH